MRIKHIPLYLNLYGRVKPESLLQEGDYMEIYYGSTRGNGRKVKASQAILN